MNRENRIWLNMLVSVVWSRPTTRSQHTNHILTERQHVGIERQGKDEKANY